MSEFNFKNVRTKQIMTGLGVIAGLGVFAVVGAKLTTNPADSGPPVQQPEPHHLRAPGGDVDPRDAEVEQSRLDLKTMQDQVDKLTTRLNDINKQQIQQQIQKQQASQAAASAASAAKPAKPDVAFGLTHLPGPPVRTTIAPDSWDTPGSGAANTAAANTPVANPNAGNSALARSPRTIGQPPAPLRGDQVRAGQGVYPPQGALGTDVSVQERPPATLIANFHMPEPSGASAMASSAPRVIGGNAQSGRTVIANADHYLATGAFAQVQILTGLDAPTGGQAQADSHPVLMRVLHFATMPNKYRQDIQDCFVTGNAWGDVSSERASIQTETLSCIFKNGRVLEVPLKGYVSGEDGLYGMRGKLVTKQGQMIANGLTAAVAAGIGATFSASSMTQTQTGWGTVQSVAPGDAFKSGFGTGVGKSADMLAQYYIRLAEKMFPVVEIGAGRVVDVVALKGVDLAAALNAPTNAPAPAGATATSSAGNAALASQATDLASQVQSALGLATHASGE